jgi:hypothetical protein
MAVSFTRALPVAPGEVIASRQLANLAAAFNDRLRSGLGDPTWRIHFLLLSLFRGMRGKADESTFPSELEFFWYYQNNDPIHDWPLAPAGDPEGINVANPLGAFVFGNETIDLWSEPTKVNEVPTGTVGMSPLNGWDIAKEQRGAVEPFQGKFSSPLYEVAKRAGGIGIIPPYAKAGMSFGSWLKMPDDFLPHLAKAESKMLLRMLNSFAREFRGSDGQRASDDYHLQEAFDCQLFFTQQFHLAPNFGIESEPDLIEPIYPKFTSAGASVVGDRFTDQDGHITRTWHAGFCLDSWRVRVTGATAPVAFAIEIDGVDMVEIHLTPDAQGFAFDVALLPVAFLSTQEIPLMISCRLTQPLPTGSIEIEFTELKARVPDISDLYSVLRCAAADQANLPDGVGTLEDQARVISDEYFRAGCIVSPRATAGLEDERTAINKNAVYDAVRRLSLECAAVSRHNEFVDYALENGKSVLWFRREFGIGEGVKVKPLEQLVDIRHAASVRGLTNEWLLDVELRPYGVGIGSSFKPEAYTDIFAMIGRCHFDSFDIRSEPALLQHVAYGQAPVYVPEAPPGWNYTILEGVPGTLNANTITCDEEDEACKESRRSFYRSCRIYEPPLEVESIVIEGTAPDELLKVTLTGRLHHCPDAPSSIARDRGTWDVSALRAEPFRSAENGLREYLLHFRDGNGQCTRTQVGNYSATKEVSDSSLFGSCYPCFRWTHLIPFAHEDDNDTQDPVDTHFRHDPFPQMELYLRAMCEGYVDDRASAEDACKSGIATLYDFRFEDLCQQAFKHPRIAVLPGHPGNSYGPLPNTEALAAVYNQFVEAVNLLTRVRVMLPSILECNSPFEETRRGVPLLDGAGEVTVCGDLNNAWGPVTPAGPGSPTLDPQAWSPCEGSGFASYDVKLTGSCVDQEWELSERTSHFRVRFALSDSDALEALPEAWRNMFNSHQEVLAQRHTVHFTGTHTITSDPAQASRCVIPEDPDFPPAFPTGDGSYLKFDEVTHLDSTSCGFEPGDVTLQPEDTGPTDLSIMRDNAGGDCGGVSASYSIEFGIFAGQVPVLAIPLVDR